MSGGGITISKLGIEETAARMAKLADFKKLAKPSVQDALDVVANKQKELIKRHQLGKAQGSVGTHIHTAKFGVYGNAGLRGGRFGAGAVAAIMLNQGTGVDGPLHKRIEAKGRHVARGHFARTNHAVIRDAMSADHTPGRGLRSKYKAATNANPSAMTGGVMTFAAYGSTAGAGSLFGARFGVSAKATTGRGKYKQQRFGALGKVFARSTVGMKAQPWADRARSESDAPARSAFAETLHQNIVEASRA
jgi:hypothetical protein